MGLLNRLEYRMKRFFQGEEGVVEVVEDNVGGYHEKATFNFVKDGFGNLPQGIVIRNPLGEQVRLPSPMGLDFVEDENGLPKANQKYETYVPGDKFP